MRCLRLGFSGDVLSNGLIEKLGLRIPQTRQEIYENVLPVLYQNGMNFYYPRDDTQFIFQNGGSFYTEDGLRSALDTPEAYAGLKEETELIYKLWYSGDGKLLQPFSFRGDADGDRLHSMTI